MYTIKYDNNDSLVALANKMIVDYYHLDNDDNFAEAKELLSQHTTSSFMKKYMNYNGRHPINELEVAFAETQAISDLLTKYGWLFENVKINFFSNAYNSEKNINTPVFNIHNSEAYYLLSKFEAGKMILIFARNFADKTINNQHSDLATQKDRQWVTIFKQQIKAKMAELAVAQYLDEYIDAIDLNVNDANYYTDDGADIGNYAQVKAWMHNEHINFYPKEYAISKGYDWYFVDDDFNIIFMKPEALKFLLDHKLGSNERGNQYYWTEFNLKSWADVSDFEYEKYQSSELKDWILERKEFSFKGKIKLNGMMTITGATVNVTPNVNYSSFDLEETSTNDLINSNWYYNSQGLFIKNNQKIKPNKKGSFKCKLSFDSETTTSSVASKSVKSPFLPGNYVAICNY